MRKQPNNISGQALLTDCEIGQALLIVLLSMSVVLTIVLSILARSTVDIGISSRSEESVRAFSAAEAGIEQALVAGPLSGTLGNDATFNANVTGFSSSVNEFILPPSFYSGESATIWFVSHDADGNLSCADGTCFRGNSIKICWGKEGTSASTDVTPAIEATVLYLTSAGDYTTARLSRAAIDPYTSRSPGNSFSAPDAGTCSIDGQTFAFHKTISFGSGGFEISPASVYTNVNGLQLARISLLYNTDMGHPVAVKVTPVGGSSLPSQGVLINSSGVSGNSTRRVEITRGFKELPGIFESAVFSSGGISI